MNNLSQPEKHTDLNTTSNSHKYQVAEIQKQTNKSRANDRKQQKQQLKHKAICFNENVRKTFWKHKKHCLFFTDTRHHLQQLGHLGRSQMDLPNGYKPNYKF